jgi:hypothetical protein
MIPPQSDREASLKSRFLEELTALQRQGETDSAFAARLGLDPATWHRIRTGKRAIGHSTQQRILRAYPALSHWLGVDATSNGTVGRADIPKGGDRESGSNARTT